MFGTFMVQVCVCVLCDNDFIGRAFSDFVDSMEFYEQEFGQASGTGVLLWFMALQRVGHNLVTKQQQ